MVHPIHTTVPGRVRFKVEGLYHCEPLQRHLVTRLLDKKGIKEVSASTLTGTLLITFNSDNTIPEISSLVERIVDKK